MKLDRRSFFKVAGVQAGLAVADLGVEAGAVESAGDRMKLSGAKEVTTACNFCSCGCGMVCHVRDGKLVNLEGDPDHVISEGGLCSKGAAMRAAHESDQRLRSPLYRAPGSDRWEKISWDQALDRIAAKMKEIRDSNWIENEKAGAAEVAVRRTDALAYLGGAQNTNEECYLFQKMARLAGSAYVEHQARL